MKKRTAILGSYDTAAHGWTLAECRLSDPEQKTNYTEKSGGDGAWDLSTVLTDGIPRYKNRSLTIGLECSQGNRVDREKIISEIVNLLDGFEHRIVLPDHSKHYLFGRLHVAVEKNTHAHAILKVTGIVEPWLYSERETIVEIEVTGSVKEYYITNNGRRAVVPILTAGGNIKMQYQGVNVNLVAGKSYQWPVLLLTPGMHTIEINGTGTLTITFSEAVLR